MDYWRRLAGTSRIGKVTQTRVGEMDNKRLPKIFKWVPKERRYWRRGKKRMQKAMCEKIYIMRLGRKNVVEKWNRKASYAIKLESIYNKIYFYGYNKIYFYSEHFYRVLTSSKSGIFTLRGLRFFHPFTMKQIGIYITCVYIWVLIRT